MLSQEPGDALQFLTFTAVVHMDTAGVVLSFRFYVSGVDRALRDVPGFWTF